MERTRDGMSLGYLGFWLNCCLLAGCLGLWLGDLPGLGLWLAFCLKTAWGSGSTDPEKVPAFFEFAGTFFRAKPIETHNDSFYRIICLDAGTFDFKISYRPANKLTDAAGTVYSPAFSTGSGHNKLTSQNIL